MFLNEKNTTFCIKTIDRVVDYVLLGIFVVTICSFFICNILFMRQYQEVFSAFEWIWFLPAVLLVLGAFFCGKALWSKSEKWILLAGFIASNLVYLLFIFSHDTMPCSDWAEVWNAAKEMAKGTFSSGLIYGEYMHEIPYQLGLAYIESLLIRAFGESYTVLKVFNVILMNILTLAVYHFAKRKSGVRVACFAYMASSIFLSWSMTVPQFTNHHLGILLLYLAIYFFEKRKYHFCLLAGIALALLNFVRPMGIVVVLTFICITIYDILKSKKIVAPVARLAAFIVCYSVCLFLLDSLLIGLNYTDVRVSESSKNIYHKITYGMYESEVDGTIAAFDYDYEAYDEAFKQEFIAKIKEEPVDLAINIANKMCRYLGSIDYLFEMTYNHEESVWQSYPIKAFYSTQWFQYVIYVALALYGYLAYRKKHKTDIYQIFYIGNTLIYIFVEAFSSYRFISYFYLIFLAGYGMNELTYRLEKTK